MIKERIEVSQLINLNDAAQADALVGETRLASSHLEDVRCI